MWDFSDVREKPSKNGNGRRENVKFLATTVALN